MWRSNLAAPALPSFVGGIKTADPSPFAHETEGTALCQCTDLDLNCNLMDLQCTVTNVPSTVNREASDRQPSRRRHLPGRTHGGFQISTWSACLQTCYGGHPGPLCLHCRTPCTLALINLADPRIWFCRPMGVVELNFNSVLLSFSFSSPLPCSDLIFSIDCVYYIVGSTEAAG